MSLVILMAAMQAGSAVPARPVVQRAVERLDMTSFRNSLNNAGGPGRRTLSQLGRHRFAWSDGELQVTESDGSWVRMFRPLRAPRGRVQVCFTDQAQNGGTYLTSAAIELSPGRNGLYRAREIRHRDCESYAR
jgi:hypothetical protein